MNIEGFQWPKKVKCMRKGVGGVLGKSKEDIKFNKLVLNLIGKSLLQASCRRKTTLRHLTLVQSFLLFVIVEPKLAE